MQGIIEVKNLTKRYGDQAVVDDISFTVESQEIFGFLGPNGAGKTTSLEMIEGLRKPDGGEIFIKGQTVWPNPNKVKNLIGVQLQSTSFYEELTVKETLALFASLYGKKLSAGELEDLLAIVGLTEKENAHTRSLSGGQQQRLAIVTTLVNEPDVIFLDEPSTGLDPQSRRNIWDVVKELQRRGKTVILTTHYMEEAEYLCDRVAIIDQGKIIALDTPQKLIDGLGSEAKVSFTSEAPIKRELLSQVEAATVKELSGNNGKQLIYSSDPAQTITSLLALAKQDNVEIKGLHVSSATLEDVFLELTGKELRD
ncbi:ABC transporter ATP-binding protein [Dethiobacter alkaliphilus]|uniref:ABC transporter related protein n=1 Tax=Dethiobacter alkaliphilus AHT 1 TaxID=555088 RepID=C0GEI1_DETAL|nr:ABC transporter ATP-binding protein [Dethiobacter alkaliphilus]EEG78475.1 ABC transporter related protein [Dethiobacter alkaliphilus AHT 1]